MLSRWRRRKRQWLASKIESSSSEKEADWKLQAEKWWKEYQGKSSY
jgi:hypothetical protein